MFILLALTGCGEKTAPPTAPPERVVRLQLEALQRADDPEPNAGIARAWEHASPDNKRMIGSIENFINVVRSPDYAPMLNCRSFDVSQTATDGKRAELIAAVTDEADTTYFYLFRLSRQTDARHHDRWMTDGVVPVRPRDPAPTPHAPGPVAPKEI